MKKLLLVFLFLLMLAPARASHIVGGEMALVHISGNLYKLELIVYVDRFGDTPGENTVFVRIFRKRDHQIILNSLSLQTPFPRQDEPVDYFQPECSDGSIETDKVFYTSEPFELSPSIYNDPEGYYISWERCCRNYGITNIYSEVPPPGSGVYSTIAGQIFYLEFPPVIKDGLPFINSSPRLFPPLRDYACPNRKYFVDFSGTDPDGDSLVYSIVTPLNSKERFLALPPGNVPNPGPYDSVQWKPGFSIDNIMNGSPDLDLSTDGLLTVTPSSISNGLYVFAVRCEEFRDGVKIGEVRRDFQMLVQEACPEAEPPVIVGKATDDPDFGTTGNLSVTFSNTVTDEDRCFEVKISDPDALKFDDGFEEFIRIKAIAIGFKKDISEVLPVVTSTTITNDGTALFTICLPACPYQESGVFQIGIIAFDNACTLPLSDTLIVNVTLEAPPNQAPQFNNVGGLTEIIEVVPEGEGVQTWPIEVTDGDNDVLNYRLVPVGFNLDDFGMSFTGSFTGQQLGPLNKTLSWDPKCDIYDFTEKNNFELYFIVDDVDDCGFNHADTTYFNLTIADFSQITPPVIDNSITSLADTLELSIKVNGDPLIVDVTGTDIDNTFILLRGSGIGFNAAAYGVSFPDDFDQGAVASQFKWQLTCDTLTLDLKNVFEFRLLVVDSLNKCGFYKADTLHLKVTVEPPDEQTFDAPNVFTPNTTDDINSFFAIARYDEGTGEFINTLPDDNCFGKFLNIRIYDRWGKQVYESTNRDFRWYGEGMPVGVYYYNIRYTNRNYKGIVSIRL